MPITRSKGGGTLGAIGVVSSSNVGAAELHQARQLKEAGAAVSELSDQIIQYGARETAFRANDDANSQEMVRDEGGNLVMPELPSGWTTYGANYRKSMQARYVAEVGNDHQVKFAELAAANAHDPEKFQAAANFYRTRAMDMVAEPVRGEVGVRATNMQAQHYAHLVSKKGERDYQETVDVVNQHLSVKAGELVNLNLNNDPNNLAILIAEDEFNVSQARAVDAGLMTPSQAAAGRKSLSIQIGVAQMLRVLGQQVTTDGKVDYFKQREMLEEFARTGEMPGVPKSEAFVSPEVRAKMVSGIAAELNFNHQTVVGRDALVRETANKQLEILLLEMTQGKYVDPKVLAAVAAIAERGLPVEQFKASLLAREEAARRKRDDLAISRAISPIVADLMNGKEPTFDMNSLNRIALTLDERSRDEFYIKIYQLQQTALGQNRALVQAIHKVATARVVNGRVEQTDLSSAAYQSLIDNKAGGRVNFLNKASEEYTAEAARIGLIPRDLVELLKSTGNSNFDPRKLEAVLSHFKILADGNGMEALKTALGENLVAGLSHIQNAPTGPEESLKLMIKFMAIPKGERENLLRSLGETGPDRTKAINGYFRKFMNVDLHGELGAIFTNVTPFESGGNAGFPFSGTIANYGAVPSQMRDDFQRNLETAITIWRTPDSAAKAAWEMTAKKWTFSKVGKSSHLGATGAARYTERAPESEYKIEGSDGSWMRASVSVAIEKVGGVQLRGRKDQKNLVLGEDMFLVPSGAADVRGQDGVKRPLYHLYLASSNASMPALDNSGRMITIDLSAGFNNETAIRAALKQKDLDAMKARVKNEYNNDPSNLGKPPKVVPAEKKMAN